MFIHYFTLVRRPFEVLEPALVDAPVTWLPALAQGSLQVGEEFRITLGLGEGSRLSKKARVRIGNAVRAPERTTLPLSIEPTGPAVLFPRLETDLEFALLGTGLTQLTLSGSYRPPLSSAGALLDRALLHRMVEAVVREFVDRVVEALRITDEGWPKKSVREPVDGGGRV